MVELSLKGELVSKITVKHWEVLVGGVGAFAAIASAMVAFVQASTATRTASELKIESAELRRLAQSAERQLAEANRIAGASEAIASQSRKLVEATEAGTAQLAVQAAESKSQREALDRSSAAATDLVDAARNESAAMAARYDDTRRAKLHVASVTVDADTFRPGQSPRAHLQLENLGSNTATYWSNGEFSVVPNAFHKTFPRCENLVSQRWPIARSTTMTSTWNRQLTAEDYRLIQAGTHKLVLTGSICWQEADKPIQRWFYCAIVQPGGGTMSCDTGNGPG